MCCLVEIGMLVFGIITLVTGKFTLSRSRVVTGPPAYAIGGLLAATLPVMFAIGFFAGLAIAARGGDPQNVGAVAILEPVVVIGVLVMALTIAFATAKDPTRPSPKEQFDFAPPSAYPAPDPNNPYSSPRADHYEPRQDEFGR